MLRVLPVLLLLAACVSAAPAPKNVLIVADEFPAMQVLARSLESGANAKSTIIKQTELPASLKPFDAVIVYIHGTIQEPPEKAFIAYAEGGGKLILLHHSISSGKRKNAFWFTFLGIELPTKPFEEGGYKYYEDIELELVNLAPNSPITQGVSFPIHLKDTEVYLNHVFHADRTPLLGIRFHDAKTGKDFEQPSGGWWKPAGSGLVFYFMPGHSVSDFENPGYARLITNALNFERK